jgi:hypothetical protein
MYAARYAHLYYRQPTRGIDDREILAEAQLAVLADLCQPFG